MKFSAACFVAALASSSAAVPLKTPRSSLKPVLSLRGGDTVTNVAAGLLGATGVASYIFPKESLENYGASDLDETALSAMRNQGPWQLALAALTLVNTDKVHAVSNLLASAAIFLMIPPLETFGWPKAPSVAWIGFLAGLGVYSLKNEVSPWVSTAILLVNGVQLYFATKSTIDLYKVKKFPSALGVHMFKTQGQTMLCTAIYLGCLAQGLTQSKAFAAAWVANGVGAVKFAYTDGVALGCPKAGPLVWAAISAVIVFLKLK
mmetsp:Transcript_28584/g.48322  ORF Transcript_28584/g.48322 Transcript_28584/m.48322 type:complete len:262 (-) Transcript_28584:185-970(-)